MHITFYLAALLTLAPLFVSAYDCHQAKFVYQVKCDDKKHICPGDPNQDYRYIDNIPDAALTGLKSVISSWEGWVNVPAVTPNCGGHCSKPYRTWPNKYYGFTWATDCLAARMHNDVEDPKFALPGNIEKVQELFRCDVHCTSKRGRGCGFDFDDCD
ncbi:hypothetical protein FKW77_000146 [Venturia effusa]|uniref:Uncharacterized protein n=1 Tax=Venturia effusa TaxID=50376 RepID=A0A517LER8_9PEZI|nr:hypothetical protein FKW77_000146 [Venturia effusa]